MNIERNREKRHARAEQRLGTRNPICHNCGENNPHCLEQHHIAGRKFDELTVHTCFNCHRKLSNFQHDHPTLIGEKPLPLEQIGHFLHGLADFFELLFRKLREFGSQLIQMAKVNKELLK